MTQAQAKPQQYLEADIISESRKIMDLISMVDSEEELTQDIIEGFIEGETEAFELIDQLIERRNEANIFIDGIKVQLDALQARKTRYQNKVDKITGVIKQALFITGLDKITRPTYTLSRGKQAPDIEVEKENLIPAEYFITPEPTLDNKRITSDARLLYKKQQAEKRISDIKIENKKLLEAIEQEKDPAKLKEKRKVSNKLLREADKLSAWLEETKFPKEIEGIKILERQDKITIRVK